MNYTLSDEIEGDLASIYIFIARHNPRRAATYLRELELFFATIAANPAGYRLREDHGEGTRIATFGNYLIVFRVDVDVVRIDRVVSGYRSPGNWF